MRGLSLICCTAAATAWTPSSFTPRMSTTARTQAQSASRSMLVMEDFGLLKGTKFGFDELWGGNVVISEAAVEKTLNKEGFRYRMWRTPEEGGGPQSIWEAIGFTASSNNAARQKAKIEAAANAKNADDGKNVRGAWLGKYGYPRLVGTKGIFYADQLSTDAEPMGGFGMGKSGVMFPVPDVVESGTYGGSKGWGMKKGNSAKAVSRPAASAGKSFSVPSLPSFSAPSFGGGGKTAAAPKKTAAAKKAPSPSLPSFSAPSLPSFSAPSFGGGGKKAAAPEKTAAAKKAQPFLTKPLGSGN